MKNDHKRALRGTVAGWSEGATRRNIAFLRSIDETRLTGRGFAVTLTLRDCPPTSAHWQRLVKVLIQRLNRQGVHRLHYVTEWQRRGVPHLHMAVWLPEDHARAFGGNPEGNMTYHWISAGALDYGAQAHAQHCVPINHAIGWFQYVAKHAARGVRHYQRASENIPEGWKSKTGRVWGKSGDWPVLGCERIVLQGRDGDGGHFAFRRLCQSWRVAQVRQELVDCTDPKERRVLVRRLVQARTMFRCNDRRRSEVRGFSEWIGYMTSTALLMNLGSRGFVISEPEVKAIEVTNE